MIQPVVIIDPLSSGVELAPTFRQRGIPCVAVSTFEPRSSLGYGTSFSPADFREVIQAGPGLEDRLRALNPFAILPGTDAAMALAERLAAEITPGFANDPDKRLQRLHKAEMQAALVAAGIPSLATISSRSETDVEAWLALHGLQNTPLVVKPSDSAGSDKVFPIAGGGDWRAAFRRVLTEPSKLDGKLHASAVVQELAIGTEIAVGTVSANGRHSLAHLLQYTKEKAPGFTTISDFAEIVAFREAEHGAMWEYTKRVLDALGVRWGATHTEIMLTANGPRLIESSPRMIGGPVVHFAREATGSSQADKLAEIFADGLVAGEYRWQKPVMPVFLRAKASGVISNVEALDGIAELPSLFRQFIWFQNGQAVKQTVDYLSNIGIVALSGDREQILRDYQKIREMEARLVIG